MVTRAFRGTTRLQKMMNDAGSFGGAALLPPANHIAPNRGVAAAVNEDALNGAD
jgi:hypothetical protein